LTSEREKERERERERERKREGEREREKEREEESQRERGDNFVGTEYVVNRSRAPMESEERERESA